MPKKNKNINAEVMKQIHQNKLKMKPRYFFMIGSIATFIGFLATIVLTILSFSTIMFLIRSNGRPGSIFRLQLMLESFPVWLFFVAIISMSLSVYIFKKYDFSYKLDGKILVTMILVLIIVSAWLMNSFGFTDIFIKRGPMRGIMKQYIEEKGEVQNAPHYGRMKIYR